MWGSEEASTAEQGAGAQWEITLSAQEERTRVGAWTETCVLPSHHGLCCLGYRDWFTPSGVRLYYKDTDKGRAVAITAQEQGLLE